MSNYILVDNTYNWKDMSLKEFIDSNQLPSKWVGFFNKQQVRDKLLKISFNLQYSSIIYPDLNKVFMIDIVETRPSEIIEIINTDINVDFDKPLDYVEPPPKEEQKAAWITEGKNKNVKISQDISGSSLHNRRLCQYKKTEGFVPFSGKGNVLGSK